jgi:putative oxidoreductase
MKEQGVAMFQKLIDTNKDYAFTAIRLIFGIVFFAHGAQKAVGWFGGDGFNNTVNLFGQMSVPAPLAVLAIAAEFLGGLCLLVGFLTRVAALGIITNMVVAISMVHSKVGFFMNWSGKQPGEGLEFHLLAIAVGLAILIKGAGAFSIDWFLAREAWWARRADMTTESKRVGQFRRSGRRAKWG